MPGGAVDHGDEAVVWMIVRVAEAVGFELVDDDIKPGLAQIAVENGLIGRDLVGRVSPLELVGRDGGDRRRIEFDGGRRSDKAQSRSRDRKREVRQNVAMGHFSLPCIDALCAERTAARPVPVGAYISLSAGPSKGGQAQRRPPA